MFNVTSIIPTIFLGIIAGILGGALGQSGAEVLLPGLLILGIVPNFKVAAGTVLLTILPPLSLLAIYEYYKRKQLAIPTALILMVSYFFAAYFGAYITKDIENKTLELISGFYFILIGIFFLWNAYTGTYGESSVNKHIHNVHSSGFKLLFR